MKNNRIYSLQILRALAALIIVFWHSVLAIKNTSFKYWQVRGAIDYPAFLNHLYIGVDIFFCISGFIMFSLIYDLQPSIKSSKNFILRRFMRIFPPYWMVTIFIIIVFFMSDGKYNVGHLSGDIWIDAIRTLQSFLLLPSFQGPIIGVGWTLIHEIIFYWLCTFTIILQINRQLHIVLLIASTISIILLLLKIT